MTVSHFLAWSGHALFVTGVADGVGGWALEGIDAGLYSKQLMNVTCKLTEGSDGRAPWDILHAAHSSMGDQLLGSCTACVVNVRGGTLEAANLGDSGFTVWRFGQGAEDMDRSGNASAMGDLVHCRYASTPQTVQFNFPIQIGAGSRATVRLERC